MNNMKNQNIVVVAMAFALALALAPVIGATPCPQWGCGQQLPEISIHSTGNILRGQIGSFVLVKLATTTASGASGTYVNFKVSGTAIPGVDYAALISPAYIGPTGYAVLSVKTLPNPRGPFISEAYSVVVTLEPGPGYSLGTSSSAQSSAQMWIK
jgi:hypothetical protein